MPVSKKPRKIKQSPARDNRKQKEITSGHTKVLALLSRATGGLVKVNLVE